MNDEHLGQLRDHGYCIVPGLLAESLVAQPAEPNPLRNHKSKFPFPSERR